MTVAPEQRAELERLGVENVRQRLDHAGSGAGSVVPGLGPSFDMTRGEVEEWLAEKSQEATKLQLNILWWAKAAAWIGFAGILVAIAIAAVPYLWPSGGH
jgi:hypothetical protein